MTKNRNDIRFFETLLATDCMLPANKHTHHLNVFKKPDACERSFMYAYLSPGVCV